MSVLFYFSTNLMVPTYSYSCTSKASKSCCSKQEMKSENENKESTSCCDKKSKESQDDCDGECNHKNCSCHHLHITGILKNTYQISIGKQLIVQKFQILNEPLNKGYVSSWLLPKIS